MSALQTSGSRGVDRQVNIIQQYANVLQIRTMVSMSLFFVPSLGRYSCTNASIHGFHPCNIITHPSKHNGNTRYRGTGYSSVRDNSRLYIGSFGLTDDGDFAILGVNMKDPDEDDETISNAGESLGGDISSLLSGTIFDGTTEKKPLNRTTSTNWQNLGTPSIDATYGSFQQGPNTSNQNKWDRTTFHVNDKAQNDIMEYLVEIMPTISEDDIENYSIALSNIGFHPKCVTMCELKYDDLNFMKVLHRRYFYNEVSGIEHPWEV